MTRAQELATLLQAALECSVFAAPLEPGLTFDELKEVAKQAGYLDGEVNDAVIRVAHTYADDSHNLLPSQQTILFWKMFWPKEEPDYRNLRAFDFVFSEFNQALRELGAGGAKLERSVLVQRAVDSGLSRNDVEVAITMLIMAEHLVKDRDGLIRLKHGMEYNPLPTEQQKQPSHGTRRRADRDRAMPIVKDVVERRSDGRPQHAEPLDAFAEALERLGYGVFRTWWLQIVGELRRGGMTQSPVSVTVLSASLVEGVLTFVVRHAQSISSATQASKTFTGDPRTWKIDDLVNSAAAGSDAAILNPALKSRADALIGHRQRIHAGRMLSLFPKGVADLRPEEARGARQTAEEVVRAVLDWLNRFPPAP